MNTKEFIVNMLSSTDKPSSTRFAYFAIIVLAIFVVLSCCFVMIYDTMKPDHTTFDFFTGIAEVIFASAVLVLCAGIPKAFSDKWKNNNNNEK